MRMKDILNCLPLVASVLSKKYGVNVHVQGDKAYTEGKNIYIPTLPITSNEQLLCMVRGFIDHESAHIRFTDFGLLKQEQLDPVTFHIFNIIEDWRVENELAKLFPGSQVNLHYLIRHFFMHEKQETKEEAEEKSSVSLLLNYMLLTVRSWDVAEIGQTKGVLQTLRLELEPLFQELLDKLDLLFQEIRQNCKGTQGSIYYAKEVVTLLKNYCSEMQEKEQEEKQKEQENQQNQAEQKQKDEEEGENDEAEESSHESGGNDDAERTKEVSLSPVEELAELLAGNETGSEKALPLDLGSLLAENLNQNYSDNQYTATVIGEVDSCVVAPMFEEEKQNALTMSIALRARLQGFLQSYVRQESAVGRRGRLHTHSLYRTSVHNPKIFCRESMKRGVNTAVHILLDASGSMDGERLSIARQACFALGKVLSEMKDVNPAITVFPANSENDNSVYPLMRHGQKLTDVTVQYGVGGTPLAPALWWAIREMLFLKENRKIIFIITDGRPDSCEVTTDALEKAEKFGFEVYGIGIKDTSIKDFLPETSAVIMQPGELVPAVFTMLQNALLKS